MKPFRIEVIDRTYAAILAGKTPAERVAMIAECHRTAYMILSAGERQRNPDSTPAQIAAAAAGRLLNGTG